MDTIFHICSVEIYNAALESGTELMQDVRGYEPIYSPDGTEVLVTGYGEMTAEQVKSYTDLNWYNNTEEV